jgi:hypothetical protein
MGWYVSKVYQSGIRQIPETVNAILNDPYLMPPCSLFGNIFDCLTSGDREGAEFYINGILEDIIWNLHHGVKQIGTKDHEIDLYLFWAYLVSEGKKNNYKYFEGEGKYSTGPNCCGRYAPICIWAWGIYEDASRKLNKNNSFIKPCVVELSQQRRNGSIGEDFLRAIGLESEIPVEEIKPFMMKAD